MAVEPNDELLAEALRLQATEEETGFASPNPALGELTARVDVDQLLKRVQHLRAGTRAERQLHARILAECRLPPRRRIEELRRILSEEEDPMVISWIVTGFRNARVSDVLPDLRALARHPSPHVRSQVPDGLSACADDFSEIAEVLLELSHDSDEDVRWSATYELGAWWTEVSDSRIESRLSVMRDNDDSQEVRETAAAALARDGGL